MRKNPLTPDMDVQPLPLVACHPMDSSPAIQKKQLPCLATHHLPLPSPTKLLHQKRPTLLRIFSSSSYISKTGSSASSLYSLPDVVDTKRLVRSYDIQKGGKLINQYLILREIGRGNHGKVKLAVDTETEKTWAIKIVERIPRKKHGNPLSFEDSFETLRREISILRKCRHPNIVQLREVIDDPSDRKIYLVLEYMDGGEILWRDKIFNPLLPMDRVAQIFRDVVSGLEYLHFQGIIHRDIKPANLLYTLKESTVKISDFGVSLLFDTLRGAKESQRSELENSIVPNTEREYSQLAKTAGSPAFLSPELCTAPDEHCDGMVSLGKPIDIWALGVTLYCLVFGKCPFMADTEFELFQQIQKKSLEFPTTSRAEPELIDLLTKMLEKDPLERITLDAVKRHNWVAKYLENPEEWYEATNPAKYETVAVTTEEVNSAVYIIEKLLSNVKRFTKAFSFIKDITLKKTSATPSTNTSSIEENKPSSPCSFSGDTFEKHSLSPCLSGHSSSSQEESDMRRIIKEYEWSAPANLAGMSPNGNFSLAPQVNYSTQPSIYPSPTTSPKVDNATSHTNNPNDIIATSVEPKTDDYNLNHAEKSSIVQDTPILEISSCSPVEESLLQEHVLKPISCSTAHSKSFQESTFFQSQDAAKQSCDQLSSSAPLLLQQPVGVPPPKRMFLLGDEDED